LIKDDDIDSIKLFWKFISSYDDYVTVVARKIYDNIKEAVQNITEEHISKIIKLDKHWKYLLEICFDSNKQIEKTIRNSFQQSINGAIDNARSNRDTSCRCNIDYSFYLAKYINGFMEKKGHDEIEEINKCIRIFQYFRDTDIFEAQCRIFLQNRLLKKKSAYEDSERHFLAMLKAEKGHNYTIKMEKMVIDMANSGQLNSEYSISFDRSIIRANVIECSIWTFKSMNWVMNEFMQRESRQFETFYKAKFDRRKLTWIASAGNAEIRMNGFKRKHNLIVTTLQMQILMMFNESSTITYGEIATTLGVPNDVCHRQLISLTTKKARLLCKENKGSKVAPMEKFWINEDFKDRKTVIRVPLVKFKNKVKKDQDMIAQQIENTRIIVMEAAIVRIMKIRKKLTFTSLVGETIKQVSGKFHPEPKMIKKRIESLIEREYLERDEETRQTLNYLA
jgi:cullin 3